MAAQRFERGASGVRLQFVIAGNHPDLAAMLHAHLGRAQDVTRRMQRNAHSIEPDRFAIGNRLDRGVLTQTRPEKLLAGLGRQVAL